MMKDYQTPNDVKNESTPSSSGLSETGRRAIQGGDVATHETADDDVAALEQRVEQLRAETEAPEAAERARLEQEEVNRLHQQSDADASQTSPEPPPGHRPQMATTELGKGRQVEGSAEMPERKLFSNIEEPSEHEVSIYREGRLR